MAGNTTLNSGELIRSEVWSSQLKDLLRDELMAARWVENLSEFPDGTTFTIPSVGDALVDDYNEGEDVKFRPLATGEFQFSITEYLSSGLTMTKKMMQDSFYADRVMAEFVPKEHRAIMEHYETETLKRPEEILGASANGGYVINGARHRFAGGNSKFIELADFAYADYALTMANVPAEQRVAIVHPSVAFELNSIANLTSVQNNPRWEGIIRDGIATGMQFVMNVYGFDVYMSKYLPADVDDSALPERDGSTTGDFSSNNGVANYFFSAAQDVLPLVGAWRQMPEVDYEYNKDKQRHEWVTTARYGVKLFRPENMVSIITDPAVS